MKHKPFKPAHSIFSTIANVVCQFETVKSIGKKISLCSGAFFVYASLGLTAAPIAHAEDNNVRAIMNSTQLLNSLDGVVPEALPILMKAVKKGEFQRLEPGFPVWIIDSNTGALLYYQGQDNFVGQAASRLVDDKGFRFGQRALDKAKNSRSTWVSLTLAGAEYRAFCAARAPYVVCTLIQQ